MLHTKDEYLAQLLQIFHYKIACIPVIGVFK